MSLAHVLLTSLLEKPSTGSELARRFDRSMGFFWQATHQQIYRELALMQEQAWIRPTQTAHRDSRKKTYQVTQLGQAQLQAWLQSPTPTQKTRNELIVKLRAEAQLGGNQLCTELQQQRQQHQSQLALYQHIALKDQQKISSNSARQHAIQQKILALGISFEQLWLTWLMELEQLLAAHASPQQPDLQQLNPQRSEREPSDLNASDLNTTDLKACNHDLLAKNIKD